MCVLEPIISSSGKSCASCKLFIPNCKNPEQGLGCCRGAKFAKRNWGRWPKQGSSCQRWETVAETATVQK